MIIQTDRTTRLLLGIIALLLTALVARPLWHATPSAYAADTGTGTGTGSTTTQPDTRPAGYRLSEVGNILIPNGVTIREMQVVDSAQALIVRMDDKINVYRVERFYLPMNTAK